MGIFLIAASVVITLVVLFFPMEPVTAISLIGFALIGLGLANMEQENRHHRELLAVLKGGEADTTPSAREVDERLRQIARERGIDVD